MAHIRERIKWLLRMITCRRQKQPDIPPAVPSTTGTQQVQQEPSRDSCPPATSASPQQPPAELWDKAYAALAKERPGLVKDYDELLANLQMADSAPNEATSSQLPAPHGLDTRSGRPSRQVLNTVIQKGLQRMEDNRATFNIAGHKIDLEDKLTKAANILLWGQDWIGTAVKNSPEASLAWSSVCLILPLFTNPTTAAEANRDGFVYVTSRMRYYVALEPLLRRLGQNDRVDDAVISAANDHIVDLYKAVLEFQLSSVLRFYQGRLKTYVRDIIPSTDWKQAQLDIKTLEDTVNSNLRQINELVAREELEHLNDTSEKTYAAMESHLSVAMQQLAILKQQQAAKEAATQEKVLAEQRKCLQLFYLTPNGDGATYDWYKDRVEDRVNGTCEWFLQHEHYQKWLSQESGPLLVSADPGCGKSVLAKYLVDRELAQQSATICYFFFKDQDQNTTRQALCALLHQLFRQKNTLIQHAMKPYNEMGAKLVESEASLWTILRGAVRDPEAGPVIFVIDALDECTESHLKSLVTNLKHIFDDQQLANVKLKVLMTSRPYKQVVSQVYRSLYDNFPHIHIPGEEEFETISREINGVIHHRVEQLATSHQLSDKIKSSLASKLLANDHRTYLWVHLVFEILDLGLFKQTDDGIDAAIQTLPNTVNEAYDQILNRSQEGETAKKALSIILAARRPLTLSEMNIAMSLDGRGRGRPIYDLDLEQDVHFKSRLRTLCGLFINVHHDKIYFLHQTAREFLIQPSTPTTVSSDLHWHHSITIRHAHSVLAEVCMFYLDMLKSTHAEKFRQDDQHGALLEYSVEYWGIHCREAEFEKASSMVDLASGLCSPDLTKDSTWASIVSDRYYYRFRSSTSVLVASRLGLTSVTELLLSRGADIGATDGRGCTALMLAAEFGHEAVTRLLLETGADVEAEFENGWTALMIAAFSGHESVTRLLLEYSANVEAKDGNGWTALMFAARFGHEAVTRLLLVMGADVEVKDTYGRTALTHAAVSGHEAIRKLLLDHGANALHGINPLEDRRQTHQYDLLSLWDEAYAALAEEMPDLVKDYDELLAEVGIPDFAPNKTTFSQLPAPHGLDTRSGHSSRQVQLKVTFYKGLLRMEDNRATYHIAGHEIDMADHISKAANFMLWGKEWIVTAVKNSPEASLVWSGISLILPLLANPTIAAEANRDGFTYVTSRMHYYAALGPLLRRLGQNTMVDEAVLSAVNDHIINLYQAILEFQLSSILRFQQRRLESYLRVIIPSKEGKVIPLHIKMQEDIVNNDLGRISDLATQELNRLNKTSEEIRVIMEDSLPSSRSSQMSRFLKSS